MAAVKRPSGSLWILLLGALLVNSALLTEIALYSRNTPEHHPAWFLGKMIPQKQPFCVWDCLRTRNLVARNRLNLAAWHGFQEVFLNRVFRFEKVRFRYRLQREAYLSVILSLTSRGYTGVRLGQSGAVAFRAEPDGRFTEQKELALKETGGPRWHTVEMTPGLLSLDGAPPVAIPTPEAGLFGFRGSLANSEVDDVEVWENGRRLVAENFRNDLHWRSVGACCLGLLTCATGAVLLGLRRLQRRRQLLWILLGHLTLLGGMLLYLLVDYAIWSARYAENEPPEQARIALFAWLDGADPITTPSLEPVLDFLNIHQPPKSEYRLQVYRDGQALSLRETPEALENFRREHPRKSRTVLFLGCSQNGGEGSLKLEDAMIPSAQRLLGTDFELISASKQGTDSSELVPRYFQMLYRFEPDLVVAYLGSNDGDPELLSANLHRLAAFDRRRKVRTVFVMEANSAENPSSNPPHLAKKHAAMREAAERQEVQAVDLDAYMKRFEGTGFLWWDEVHMTSYGHRLSGEFLADVIRKVFQAPRASE